MKGIDWDIYKKSFQMPYIFPLVITNSLETFVLVVGQNKKSQCPWRPNRPVPPFCRLLTHQQSRQHSLINAFICHRLLFKEIFQTLASWIFLGLYPLSVRFRNTITFIYLIITITNYITNIHISMQINCCAHHWSDTP